MISRRRVLTSAVVFGLAPSGPAAFAQGSAGLSPKARDLDRILDSYDLAHRWLAGEKVHWETGEPTGARISDGGRHTHCSAFVASVAKRLGIYILRPPEHSATLLANAQIDWLLAGAAAAGWQSLADAAAAQHAANQGDFVVACYRNHNDDKPGHIAIVRPSLEALAGLGVDGPAIAQAGTLNYNATTLRVGFAGHPHAWARGREIRFFAHAWDGTGKIVGS